MQELALLYFSAYSVVTVARPTQRAMGGVGGESSLVGEAAKHVGGGSKMKTEFTYSLDDAERQLGLSTTDLISAIFAGEIRAAYAVEKEQWFVSETDIGRILALRASVDSRPSDDTPSWLHDHLPSAERWWRLWLADREALRLAREACDTLPASRGDRLLTEHQAAERTASLYYLSELIAAEVHATKALAAHDVRPAVAERVKARKARLSELINEVLAATEPKS
jgi:hypothetical protein